MNARRFTVSAEPYATRLYSTVAQSEQLAMTTGAVARPIAEPLRGNAEGCLADAMMDDAVLTNEKLGEANADVLQLRKRDRVSLH